MTFKDALMMWAAQLIVGIGALLVVILVPFLMVILVEVVKVLYWRSRKLWRKAEVQR
jgi:hypothetical protein